MSSPGQPSVSIRGEKVALGPLDRSIIPLQTRWINDFPTTRTLGRDAIPLTLEDHERWYTRSTSSETALRFCAYDLADMMPVGTVGLFDIDRRHGTCELGLGIMELSRRGRGLGTDAVILIAEYAIRDLGMHNVQLRVFAYNHAGIRAYEKAGFREYGRRREAWLHNGRRWDIVYMEVLATEWLDETVERPPSMHPGHQ